jgi:hypothetical protein
MSYGNSLYFFWNVWECRAPKLLDRLKREFEMKTTEE